MSAAAKPRKPRNPLDVGTAKTTRLRKLECSEGCGYIARVSRTAMRRGLPGCYCGGTLVPAELSDVWDAQEAGVLSDQLAAQRPCVLAYERELHSIERGQERKAGNGRALGLGSSRSRAGWADPHSEAAARAHTFARSEAAALRAAASKLSKPVDSEPIPF